MEKIRFKVKKGNESYIQDAVQSTWFTTKDYKMEKVAESGSDSEYIFQSNICDICVFCYKFWGWEGVSIIDETDRVKYFESIVCETPLSMSAIKKALQTVSVCVANNRVYCLLDEGVIMEFPIEWLSMPNMMDGTTIAVYTNTLRKGSSIVMSTSKSIIHIFGHKKIGVQLTGAENSVYSQNENVLLSVVEERNNYNYAYGKFLKSCNGTLYDMDTGRYELRISDNQYCPIIITDEGYRAGIWDVVGETIIDQGTCQMHYLDDWFPITQRFSKRSNKIFDFERKDA